MMKKYILGLIAFAMISFSGFASTDVNSEKLATNVSKVNNFTLDLGNVTKMTDSELSLLTNKFFETNLAPLPNPLQCTITIKGTVDVGVASFEITITVSGDCSEVAATAAAAFKTAKDLLTKLLQ
jgi:hypothetical protein